MLIELRKDGLRRLQRQADVLCFLAEQGIIPHAHPWVDYGCGSGVLADTLSGRGFATLKYEPYMSRPEGNYISHEALLSRKFSLVINTAVFEHLRDRSAIDEILDLAADAGIFAFHTFVDEKVPDDPGWVYYLPVHCTVYTNQSMNVLFEQKGFTASMYHAPSEMWFWFRDGAKRLKRFARSHGGFYFSEGFVKFPPTRSERYYRALYPYGKALENRMVAFVNRIGLGGTVKIYKKIFSPLFALLRRAR